MQAVVAREKPISFAKTPGRDPTIGEGPRHLRFFKNVSTMLEEFQTCLRRTRHTFASPHFLRRRLFAATVLGTCLHLCPPGERNTQHRI